MLKIKLPAIKLKDGRIFTGLNHQMIEDKLCEREIEHDYREDQQGFITNKGEFVGRRRALIIAKEAGQIKGFIANWTTNLLSEHLGKEFDSYELCKMKPG